MILQNGKITASEIDRLKSRMGLDLRIEQFNSLVTEDNILKFVRTIGDDNPLWCDCTYAKNTVYGNIIAPPSFLYTVINPTGALAGGLPGVHSFHGGNEWEFFRPIRLNNRISATAQLTDIVEKKSSKYGGHSVIVTVEVTYKDDHGILARAKGWSVRVEREEGKKREKYANIPFPKYTLKEIEAIEESCLNEKPYGVQFRYWDDVEVGDDLITVIKGPLGFEDMENFLAASLGTLSYRSRINKLRKHPAFFYRDPNTNGWEPVSCVTLYDYVAQDIGIPKAHDLGSQRMSWLIHLLTNWMGDDGFLEKLNVRLDLPNLFGDTTWCKGKVARKYTEGEKAFVVIDVWCENQRKERTAHGSATVQLLTRKLL